MFRALGFKLGFRVVEFGALGLNLGFRVLGFA